MNSRIPRPVGHYYTPYPWYHPYMWDCCDEWCPETDYDYGWDNYLAMSQQAYQQGVKAGQAQVRMPRMPKANPAPNVKNIYTGIPPENTDLGIAERMNFRVLGSQYVQLIREYITSKSAGTADVPVVLEHLKKSANENFGMLLNKYYSLSSTTKFLTAYETMTTNLTAVIDLIVAGQETTAARETLNASIMDVAAQLNALDSVQWPVSPTNNLLTQFANSVINQADYRKASAWESSLGESGTTYQIMVSGTPTYGTSFYDALSLGIIQAQPWRFPS